MRLMDGRNGDGDVRRNGNNDGPRKHYLKYKCNERRTFLPPMIHLAVWLIWLMC